MWTTLAVLAAGFGSGVLASVLGVGGAVITTPMIRALGATPIEAVGSTVPAILPGALSGSLRYHREGYIVWPVALTCGLSGMAFAVLGGWVADVVDARWLMVLTAVLVMWCGVSLLRDARRTEAGTNPDDAEPAGSPVRPRGGAAAMVALGVGAGFLAGLLGIGGGLILTPGLTLGLRLPVKQAIATSLSAVAMMSTTAVVTHIVLGHVDWRFAAPLAIGIVPGARVGAHITVGASEQRMRLVAGALLIAVSIVYLAGELVALASRPSADMVRLRAMAERLDLPPTVDRSEEDAGANTDAKGARHFDRYLLLYFGDEADAGTIVRKARDAGWDAPPTLADPSGASTRLVHRRERMCMSVRVDEPPFDGDRRVVVFLRAAGPPDHNDPCREELAEAG